MFDFTPNSDHHAQEQRIRDYHDTPCIICGKGVKEPWSNTVHVFWGFTVVTEQEAAELDSSGDLGLWPIGNDCLRNHSEILPYVTKG